MPRDSTNKQLFSKIRGQSGPRRAGYLLYGCPICWGVPVPEVLYESRKIQEKKGSRVIYIPKRSLEEEMDHASLMGKYDYNGKLPREILIITLRRRE